MKTTMMAAVLCIASGACLMGLASVAQATTWRGGGALAAGARDAGASVSALTASNAWADSSGHKIRAGAHYPGGWTLYAGFAEGWGYACHSYSPNNLGALIENPHTVTQDPVVAGHQNGGAGC